ncbi:MAG: hypothetical protein V3W04_15760 [Gammaproteobacteria bacterium]
MAHLPEKDQQIVDAHMGLIHRVVIACNNPGNVPDLEELLQQAENNDWKHLVATIRKIIAGNRSEALLKGLDDEDQAIITSILRGLQNPQTLPDLTAGFDAGMAAPGIAAMVNGSRKGNVETLQLLGDMAQQMLQAGGDMARLAGILRPLVEGERDADKLSAGMTQEGQQLVVQIIHELGKLETH